MAADQSAGYRSAIARFATGVTVITTATESGPTGMTASAVCSLSLDPLLILVCIGNGLPTRSALAASGRFAVNVLGEGDEELATRFASRGVDRFAGLNCAEVAGVPVLADAIAHFVCDVTEAVPGGDHSIFIGRVITCDHVPWRKPLVYFASEFGALVGDRHDPWNQLALHDSLTRM
jgi:flavin reductase (DIM6/NTAB) family NADH-FMN oxidoreductase RutF